MAGKILFIGGTRFFGRRIVADLLAHGHDVTLLTRGGQPTPDGLSRLHHIRCDRRDGAAFENALGGLDFDAVIDNVCYRPADAEQAVRTMSDRCERYIFTSSVMSYLNICLNNQAIAEKDWVGAYSTDGLEYLYEPGELEYARNKWAAEQVFLGATGFKPIVFRLHNVVGEDDFSGKSRLLMEFLQKFDGKLRMVGGKGDLYQQVYAGDLEEIYRRAIELPTEKMEGAYNIAAPPVEISEYLAMLGAALGTNAEVEFFNEGGDDVLPRGVPYPKNVILDCSLLRRDFGFAFTGYEDFLPDIARWYGLK